LSEALEIAASNVGAERPTTPTNGSTCEGSGR
jgi:hypothetical protein